MPKRKTKKTSSLNYKMVISLAVSASKSMKLFKVPAKKNLQRETLMY